MNVKVQNQPLEHKRTVDGLCGPGLEMFRGQVQRGNDMETTTASIMQFVNIWLWKNFMRGKTKLRPCQLFMLFPGTCANNSFLWKEDKSLFTLFPQNCWDVFWSPTLGVASVRKSVGHLSNPLSSCPHLGSHFCSCMLRKRNPMNRNPGKKIP